MGVNVMESELGRVSVENGKKESSLNGGLGVNEPISFGKIPEINLPKDAVDEWPEEKKFHYVYFVKYRSVEDQNLKSKLEQSDKELTKLNQARNPITEKLRAKRAERAQVISQLKALGEERKHFKSIMDDKRKEIEPLQQALGKLRAPSNGNRDNRSFICSSAEELNDVIRSLEYRIQHESINLNEEKKIIREIKQLEGTRDKVIANAAMRAEIQKSVGEKDSIQDQVKLIGVDLDGVRKDQEAVKSKIKTLEAEKEAIDNVVNSLEEELQLVTEKRDKVYEKIRDLRNKREEGNSCFYQNRSLLNEARNLAANKDVTALKKLSVAEVGKFMSQWNKSKSCREDYEKRISQSLDYRQLSKDGRMRNPEEKPLVSQETLKETEFLVKPKEEPVPPPAKQSVEIGKTRKTPKDTGSKIEEEAEEDVFDLEKKSIKTIEVVDVAKLKEIEMAKAKQALERKKKLAEKAAAKAKIKAEKEAEKKLKEREKKLKKKMQASAPAVSVDVPEAKEETVEVETTPEPEKVEENVKFVEPIRRKGRAKVPEAIPKVILKRRKSSNNMYYYYYAASGVAALVAFSTAIGYHIYA